MGDSQIHHPAVLAEAKRLVRTRRLATPLLVLDGADDFWGKGVARATARAYQTEAEFFADMGHNMMLEPGWSAVAERIHTWLETGEPRRQKR